MTRNAQSHLLPFECICPSIAANVKGCIKNQKLGFLLLLIFAAIARDGSGQTAPPPPKGLPRVLSQCDVGANATICGMWTWNGSAYDGVWENTQKGVMTVTIPAPGRVVFQRVDTAGGTPGLTGSYTARWDGKVISDAKFVWKYNATSMEYTWTAVRAIAPVVCFRRAPGPPEITNLYQAPLTAYTFVADRNDKGAQMNTSNETYDIRLPNRADHHLHAPPVQLASVPDVNCSNADAYGYPSHISMAIFADGASFGEQAAVAAIMVERNTRQRDYKATYDQLCTLGQQGKSFTEISQALDQLSAAGSQASPSIERNFSRPARNPADVRLRLTASLQQLKTARDGLLADPVKDEHGKLYITDTPSSACISPDGSPF